MKRLIESIKISHVNLSKLEVSNMDEKTIGKDAVKNIEKSIAKFNNTNFKSGDDISKAAEKLKKMIDDLKKIVQKK